MLQLQNIVKTYGTGDTAVEALKGVSLSFREHEFVSILGPSGCGKTTLLNLIGGLDSYTSGDLSINGVSTKAYKARDWDAYRNHSIGFVFQSYNLIPHQSVLQNVELALTLSGVSKRERKKRAKEALQRVGLSDQLRKRPAEMSGGQMQRVAIARAIVNDPDIILADEPTGALDTETSVQVMEILKEISRDRLVIMVTHNPDLAGQYSTRIVRMLDGRITDDSAPLSEEELRAGTEAAAEKVKAERKKKMPSMSFATSFGLSLKNLFTKKGRTLLTSFAGSIGIIGIALIYAVSCGTTRYIDTVQEDTLSSYPLTLESQHMDMGTLLTTFMGKAESIENHDNDAVYQKAMVYELMNALSSLEAQENDLASFKTYLERERATADTPSGLDKAVSGVQYTYNLDLLIYTKNVDGKIIRSDSQELMQKLIMNYMSIDMSALINARDSMSIGGSSQMMANGSRLWQEMLPGKDGKLYSDLLEKQYDLVYGSWPTEYNEIVIVLDKRNEIDDMTLYALGLKSEEEIETIMKSVVDKTDISYESKKWTYEEICDMEFRTILNSDCFTFDEETGLFADLRDTDAGVKYLYDNGIPLKVSGIIRPSESAVSSMLTGSIGYTSALTEYVAGRTNGSDAVKAQLEDPSTDVFTGLPFRDTEKGRTEENKAADFREYVTGMNEEDKAAAYVKIMSNPTDEAVEAAVGQTVGPMTREQMEQTLLQTLTAQMSVKEEEIVGYLSGMSDDELRELFGGFVAEQFRAQYAAQTAQQLAVVPKAQLASMLDELIPQLTQEQCAKYYDDILVFSENTYEDNLEMLGCVDLDKPASINLFASTFADKDVIEEAIASYNDSVDELHEIRYTDYVGLLMSSVTTVINAITYVLIAFVAVSLVVSSIMIGVITLISVQERTKEIGILRAIGASKRNVSSMFNAETVIIGFFSGAIGVLITYLLCLPINLILHALTDIETLSATLPVSFAAILVGINVLLMVIAGFIPSRSAAKKDPVVALRTE